MTRAMSPSSVRLVSLARCSALWRSTIMGPEPTGTPWIGLRVWIEFIFVAVAPFSPGSAVSVPLILLAPPRKAKPQ